MAAYLPTAWVNYQSPALSAANLNKLTNELKSQATAKGISNTLPTWADGAVPALSDAVPLNEMERVTAAVATSFSLSYVVTTWSAGWSPARNATRLNRLEIQAQANRAAIDAGAAVSTVPLHGLLMINSVTNWPDVPAMAQRTNLALLASHLETSRLAQLKGANPNCRVIPYQNWGFASSNTPSSSPITYTEALNEGWLATYGGQYRNNGYSWLWACNCGKAGYGQRWAQAAVARLAGASWNGTFMDDVTFYDRRLPSPYYPDGYASYQAYQTAVGAQLQIACNYIRSQGKISVANVGGLGDGTVAAFSIAGNLQPYPDVSMAEFMGNWSGGASQDSTSWLPQIAAIQNAKSLGRQVWGNVSLSSLSDTQRGKYGDYLSRIWGEFGTLIISMQPTYGDSYWSSSFATDHGAATGAAVRTTTNTWQRSFADGTTLTIDASAQVGTP